MRKMVNIAGILCPISDDAVNAELAIPLPQAHPPLTSEGRAIEATLRGSR
jgi:hypothetical protein